MQNQKALKKNENSKNILYFLLALYMIYSTDSLVVALGVNRAIEYGSYAILGACAVIFLGLMLLRNNMHISLNLFVCVVCVALSSLVNFDSSLIGWIKISSLIVGCYIATQTDQKKFIKAFVYLMALIAAVSLVLYFFRDFFVGLGMFPVMKGYKDQEFVNFFLTNVRINSLSVFRNWGPFWEPGAYQIYLITSLTFLMFEEIDFKHKNLLILIFLVTLGTVMSTTGFFAIPFLLLAFIFDTSTNKKALFLKTIVVILATGFAVWFFSSEYFDITFTDKLDMGADLDRFATIRYGLQLFLKKPIFGYSSAYTAQFHEMAGTSFSITNTFIGNLVVYGLIVGLLSVALLYAFVRGYRKSVLVTVLIFMALLISFSGENVLYCPMFSFLMFYRAYPRENHRYAV